MTKKKLEKNSTKTTSKLSPNSIISSNTGEKVEHLWNAPDVVAFAEKKIGIKLDQWQKDYINTEGNVAVRAGRQSGKSFAQSLRAALFALMNDKTQTLIIGAVDRQSVELFEKVKSHIYALAKHMVMGKDTLHKIELTNGSRIIALPAGRTGYGLRNYTIHKLVVDEAHYVPEEVYTAVRPMLATTGGTMDLLSTPKGNSGFFYEAFQSDDFTTYHTKSEYCPRIDKKWLDGERKRMTKLQFAQEYEAEFLDNLQAFFPLDLIKTCEHGEFDTPKGKTVYMGVDVARYGGDENAFVIMEMKSENKMRLVHYEVTERVSTTDTMRRIIDLDKEWNFRKVYIDDGGIGGAVLDVLLETPPLKRKVVGINNASRPIVPDKKRTKKILKEDLYGNLRRMFEQQEISLPFDERIRQSLTSIQFEYDQVTGNLKIYGRYSHITEAMVRAAWAVKTKGLSLWARWS